MSEFEIAGPDPRSPALVVLDKALALQAPLVERHVARIRRSHPDATPSEIERRLARRFRATTIGAGLTVGAISAAPKVSKKTALTLSSGQKLAYLNAAVLYVLARAHVHRIEIDDVERRRGLTMAILLGQAGSKQMEKVAERTGQHWAKQLVQKLPYAKIKAVNNVLGKNFVTKYGTTEGIVVLGQLAPKGIGAVIGGTANAITSHGVIKTADHAFGPAPEAWLDTPAQPSQPPDGVADA